MCITFYLSKFSNAIFIHVELKGNCGEDVCLTNASTIELVNHRRDLLILSPQFSASYFLCKVL